MPVKMKMRSSSTEDLGNIVKKMIDGVLEDNDQVAELYQAVFEEYYSKKMEELKKVKDKIDADRKHRHTAENPEIVRSKPEIHLQPSNFEIGDTEPEDIAESFSKQSDSHKMTASPLNSDNPDDGRKSTSSNSALALNPQKTNEEAASSLINEEPDTSVVHVVRRPKYIRVVEHIHGSDTVLGLAKHHTTTDLTRNPNATITLSATAKDEVKPEENSSGKVNVFEFSNSTRTKVASKKNPQKPREISVEFKSKGKMTFENWKKMKTDTYLRVFREEHERKQLDQAKKAQQNAKKEAANAAYLYWKRRQDARRKSSNHQRQVLGEIQESRRMEMNEKRRVNSEAFRAWKKQKDVKSRERRMCMMPQQRVNPQQLGSRVHVAFNKWLNQLDCVLHQKYLRERRYLVRSFYCQPTYFGTAALCS